jgi:hypothetical protein
MRSHRTDWRICRALWLKLNPTTPHSTGFYKGEDQMYYPQDFDRQKAIELGNLVKQAYDQYTAYKNEKPWTLKDGYELKGVITYVSKRRLRGFVARADDTGPTLLDREMDAAEREHPALLKTRDGLFRTEEPVGFLAAKGNDAYLIFRGTQTPWEFLQDLKIKMKSYPYIIGHNLRNCEFLSCYTAKYRQNSHCCPIYGACFSTFWSNQTK